MTRLPLVRYRPNGVREIIGFAEVDYEVDPQGNPPKLYANIYVDDEIKKEYEGLVGSFKISHRTTMVGDFITNNEPEVVYTVTGMI